MHWLRDLVIQMETPSQEDRYFVRRLGAYDKLFKCLQLLQSVYFRDGNRNVVGRIGCVAGNAGPKKVDKVPVPAMILGARARVLIVAWANNVRPGRGPSKEFQLAFLQRA